MRDDDDPRRALYRTLRDLWLAGDAVRTSAHLAAHLSVPPQRASQWATGTTTSDPPWSAILWLLRAVDARIVISPEGATVLPLRTGARHAA